jgi:antitoxin ParD1/3/4
MADLTVSLPDPIRQFVEAEAAAKGFANPGDYVQDIIYRAYRDKARKELEAKLVEGVEELEQGDAAEMTAEDWAEIHADVEKSFQERKTG